MTTCLNCGHADDTGFAFCPKCGTKAPEAGQAENSLIGCTLNGKYRVISELGAGGMGTVYTGEHVGLKKQVALKVLHPDLLVSDEQLQRFQREGIAAGKFSHPNAIQIFDFDKSEDGTIYLAMELVAGTTLKDFLTRKGKLSVAVSIQLTRQILGCLAEAHRVGIIHRDLKPDNIMVVPGSRGEVRIKVLDFGLSKLVDLAGAESSLVTQAGRILGTPLYMAPEQCSGDEADARSDLYAVGLMLYEMISGKRPFSEESTSELLFTRVTKEAPSMIDQLPQCGIAPELDAVLMHAMQRRREDRYQLAEEMMAALENVPLSGSSWNVSGTSVMTSTDQLERHRASLQGSAQEHLNESSTDQPRSGGGLKFLLMGLGAALCLGLLTAGLLYAISGTDENPAPAAPAEPVEARILRARELPPEARSTEQMLYLQQLDFARQSLLAGHPAQARTSISQALVSPSADSEANLLQAQIYGALGDVDAAAASYQDALDADPGYLEALLGLGWLQLERGDLQDAQASFAAAEGVNAESPDVAAALGVVAWQAGDDERAFGELQRALQLDGNNPLALTYLGRLQLERRDTVQAIDLLVNAKRYDPGSWRAPAWLGDAYLASGREEDAETQWRAAYDLHPTVELSRSIGTLMLEGGRFAEARRFLQGAMGKFPRDGRLFALRAAVEHQAGNPQAALGDLRQALAQGESDGQTRTLLAMVLHTQGQLSEAIDTYERVIADKGDLPSANLGLGLAYFEVKRYPEAQARLLKVLDYDPQHLGALLHLGLLHMEYLDNRDDSQRAHDYFQEYQRLGGDDARVSDWLLRL